MAIEDCENTDGFSRNKKSELPKGVPFDNFIS